MFLFKSFENHWSGPFKDWTLGIRKGCSLTENLGCLFSIAGNFVVAMPNF